MSRAEADLYYLHEGLPRQAPGSDASTLRAIAGLGLLPPNPAVLDIGCGPGRSAMMLAGQLGAHVTAIDIHQPYLDQLSTRAESGGVGHLIQCRNVSMTAMNFPREAFDVIWAEGSAYFLGIRESLEAWLPLLKPGGCAAFTELCWLDAAPPPEALEYWKRNYPPMTDSPTHLATAASLGYGILGSFTLPAVDWWDEYLTPLEARIQQLASGMHRRRALAGQIAESRRAIALIRRYPDAFGYVFHLVAKPSPAL